MEIENCTEDLYKILRKLRESYSNQMELRVPYDVNTLADPGQTKSYEFTRALIESVKHGAHHFISAGEIEITEIRQQLEPGGSAIKQIAIRDQRKFEGWRKIK